jgi:hypothetical protein
MGMSNTDDGDDDDDDDDDRTMSTRSPSSDMMCAFRELSLPFPLHFPSVWGVKFSPELYFSSAVPGSNLGLGVKNILRVSVVFLSPSLQILGLYGERGHDQLFANNFIFIIIQ